MSDKDLRDVAKDVRDIIADEVEAWADDGTGDLAALRDLARRLREVEAEQNDINAVRDGLVDLLSECTGDDGATLKALDALSADVRDLALSVGIVPTGQETAHELVELVGRWIDGAVDKVTMTRDEWLRGLDHDDRCETVGDILEQIVFDCITHGQDMGPCGMTDETGADVGMLLTAMLLDQWQRWILDATIGVAR